MKPRLFLKNFRIVDETADVRGSVLVEDGLIKEVLIEKESGADNTKHTAGHNAVHITEHDAEHNAARITAQDAAYNADIVLDGGGRDLALMPAFVDLHAHFREPGFSEKETLESACLAAAAGGYGTVVCMANTVPVTDAISRALSIRKRCAALGLADVYPVLSLTQNMEGKALSEIVLLKEKGEVTEKEENPCDIRLLSEDGKDVADDEVFLAAMAEARRAGIPVSCHCDLGGENNATRRSLDLGKKAGCRLHIAHVSTKEAAAMIREAKKTNPSLTCETTPHHIALTGQTAAALGSQSHGKVSPPLRTEEDRQALIAAIVDGTVDALATDHAPHTQADKEKGSPGFTGLETAFAVCYSALAAPGHISLSKLSSLMSAAPARLLGLDRPNGAQFRGQRDGRSCTEHGDQRNDDRAADCGDHRNDQRAAGGRGRIAPGLRADFAIADLSARWTVDPAAFMSRGKNSPFAGRELRGRIALTIRGGHIVFDGRLI